MPIDTIMILEWAALAAAILWAVGLFGLAAGSRRARYAFRGKGYLRPPSGRAWLRFLHYKHYDSFEDASIRFYYTLAHICLVAFVVLSVCLAIFLGLLCLLRSVSTGPSPY